MPAVLTFEDYDMNPTPEQTQKIYESGFKGIIYNPMSRATMLGVTNQDFYEAFPRAKDIGKGKMSAPFKAALSIEPEFGRMENQKTGDCVSHEVRNACSMDWYCDLFFGETKVPVGAKPRLAVENIYGDRGHGGQGADPYRLGNYVSPEGKGGLMVRMKYTGPNGQVVDLTVYTVNIGINWGRTGVPAWINEIGSKNKALRVFRAKSLYQCRDAMAMGFGVGRGSWMSFSSTRNKDGFAERTREGWSHAEAWIGFDDTPGTVKTYGTVKTDIGCPLEQNSWGVWNGGPKRHEQPDGSYFMYQADAQRMIDDGEVFIFCSVRGYERELVYDRERVLSELYAA